MNTGIQEAVDIGWKLAAVLAGWGGARLLASYDLERRPVAQTIVDEAARNFTQFAKLPIGDDIDAGTPAAASLRRAIGNTIIAERFDREYEMEGVALGYRLEDSPIVVADGTPVPPFEVTTYSPSARPGHRAPHGWLAAQHSTLDLFGRDHTLLRFGPDVSTAALTSAASARGVPLPVVDIDDPELARLYARKLVLVRPDGFVAWRDDGPPADALDVVDMVRGG